MPRALPRAARDEGVVAPSINAFSLLVGAHLSALKKSICTPILGVSNYFSIFDAPPLLGTRPPPCNVAMSLNVYMGRFGAKGVECAKLAGTPVGTTEPPMNSASTMLNGEAPPRATLGWQLVVSVICLAIMMLGLYRQVAPQPYQAPDFSHTYKASRALRDGTNVYAPALAWVDTYQRGQPFKDQYFYAPTYALLLTPLTLLPYQTAIEAWGMCLLIFLCVAVYGLFRASGESPPVFIVLLVATAASITSAVRAEYFLGQANLFMLCCMCLAIWARQANRPGLGGGLLALALVTKPMLALITAYFLWKREFKFAFTTVVGFLILLLAPFLWLGREALENLLTLWRFYSSQYLSFAENISPRGMLERLFTINPVVRPLAEMPALAVALWLVVVVAVGLLTVAVIAPHQFKRENRSLIEFGTMISGLMLISPLTEPPYLVLLIMPLVASFIYLRSVGWRQARFRWTGVALAGIFLAELVPRAYTEPFFWRHLSTTDPFQVVLLTVFSPTHFYILLATFLLQLHILSLISGTTTLTALQRFARDSPMLVRDWLRDLFAVRSIAPREQ
jgi:hypothetical protein